MCTPVYIALFIVVAQRAQKQLANFRIFEILLRPGIAEAPTRVLLRNAVEFGARISSGFSAAGASVSIPGSDAPGFEEPARAGAPGLKNRGLKKSGRCGVGVETLAARFFGHRVPSSCCSIEYLGETATIRQGDCGGDRFECVGE
jgi:hypothetical protein